MNRSKRLAMTRRLVLSVALVAGSAVSMKAQMVTTLQAVADNTIYSNNTSLSSGVGDIVVGRTQRFGLRRGLIRFDIASGVPAGATVTSVALSMNASNVASAGLNTALHVIANSWGEGTSSGSRGIGAPATTGDATWMHRFFPNTNWTTSGGDFAATASATAMVNLGGNTWSSAQMVTDVQNWLDNPSTDHGWMLIGAEAVLRSAIIFRSRHGANAPSLVVSYNPPMASAPRTGQGCGPNGGVQLDAVGVPQIGNASFAVRVSNGPASGVASFYLAFGLNSAPVTLPGGCTVYLDPATAGLLVQAGVSPFGPVPLDAAGGVVLPLAIANQTSLIGARIDTQVLVPAVGAPNGFYLSNALSIKIGV